MEIKQDRNFRAEKCPICSRDDYEWGRMIVGKSVPGQSAVFRPNNSSWNDNDAQLDVRRCLSCGNVQFFTVEE